MSYPDAVDAFVRAAAGAGIDVVLSTPKGDAAQQCETVFGKALAADICMHGYPERVGLPWIAEELYVYGLDELSDRQAGYRTDARDGSPSRSWNAAHHVFADWAADPVTVAQDGVVCYARHGMGAWNHSRIAADVPAFFLLLAAWLRYVSANGEDLYDENFEIPDKTRADIRQQVAGVLDEADRDAACRFVLGEF